ncbi:hypothetical protein M378DRAFT_166715 [Amanita muscaria Koide BX008]|uniref:Uncharacterized protein n=1 Tax=Amanita muscaria (strain Koide BX008) TaxID=946122 RepID=A0A0C2WJA7_AMAMK|nr:hypothetical protein M378DRAFT_166715 [Amanita muscaria Koide BX008]
MERASVAGTLEREQRWASKVSWEAERLTLMGLARGFRVVDWFSFVQIIRTQMKQDHKLAAGGEKTRSTHTTDAKLQHFSDKALVLPVSFNLYMNDNPKYDVPRRRV